MEPLVQLFPLMLIGVLFAIGNYMLAARTPSGLPAASHRPF
jgi:hypothetical protein